MKYLLFLELVFDFIGILILVVMSISGMRYTKLHQQKGKQRYWLHNELKIVFTFPPKFKRQSRHARIPPKIIWTLVGLLFIVVGVLFRVFSNSI